MPYRQFFTPTRFQWLINHILKEKPGKFVIMYSDNIIFTHVFWQYRILEDIMINWGAHITSWVRSSFLKKLEVSHTSIYDLLVNGQVERDYPGIGLSCKPTVPRTRRTRPSSCCGKNMSRILCHSAIQRTLQLTNLPHFLETANPSKSPAINDLFRWNEHINIWNEQPWETRHHSDTPQYEPGDRIWLSIGHRCQAWLQKKNQEQPTNVAAENYISNSHYKLHHAHILHPIDWTDLDSLTQ